ncbi:UDP-glucosyltransferase 2-like [Diorhabda sublineata]|uniref:UDP-glucosyltransferase 2-like n=1 Tax=Diorhabda sublineata TaxID=1163346 RepID=UPI0024E0D086|nr:UDP-glucosyltransferase 2-like [Diorhabda sublineata]
MVNIKNIFFLFPFILYCDNVAAYKYLGVFPFFAKSHYFLGNELMKGLAKAGHEVTILTVYEEKDPPNENYKQIVLKELLRDQIALITRNTKANADTFKDYFSYPTKHYLNLIEILDAITEMVLNQTEVQKMIKEKPKFDAVIITHFNLEALKALAPHFGAHQVIFYNHGASNWINHLVGTPNNPSFDPVLILGYTGHMNFKERLINTWFTLMQYLVNKIIHYPHQNGLVRKYISEDLDLNEILYNVSLALYNSHVSFDRPVAAVPCVKDIAGFHIKPPKTLPDDLQKYLDEANEGVIYFSLGSQVKSIDLPLPIRDGIMEAFSKRKERIIWKFEDDSLPGKPENVKIEKWVPQMELLAHPNVKLFITHGGILSSIEAVYHGIPLITIPILGDQLKNAILAESLGYSKTIYMNDLNDKHLSAAIEEVVSDKKFAEKAKARSKAYHDRPMDPMNETVYWLEYIVRHNGAPHLRVPQLDLAWYQYYLLDVVAFIFLITFLMIYLIRMVAKIIYRVLCFCCRLKKVKKQ